MGTTALVAELIVIGLQGSLWLVLIAWFVGLRASDYVSVETGKTLAPYLAAAAVAWFYSFGAVLDRIFHAVADLTQIARWPLKVSFLAAKSRAHSTDRIVEEYYHSGILKDYFQYIVARWRILRATFFNFLVLSAVLSIVALAEMSSLQGPHRRLLLVSLGGSILFTLATFGAFVTIDNAKDVRGRQIREHFAPKTVDDAKARAQ